jgi:hypothetical protein
VGRGARAVKAHPLYNLQDYSIGMVEVKGIKRQVVNDANITEYN